MWQRMQRWFASFLTYFLDSQMIITLEKLKKKLDFLYFAPVLLVFFINFFKVNPQKSSKSGVHC